MKVLKPSKNRITQGYSDKHKGYDHSGNGDPNYYASFAGKVVLAKNSETKNWINKGKLTTADYGNYIKIKANVDGKTIYQLGAHFKQGTVLPQGTEVKKGQVVAQIGNTGNSTGPHSHTEYRDENEKNFSVQFVDEEKEPEKQQMDKHQLINDIYKATTGEYASNDEINARLQENKNVVEMIEDRLYGDSRAKTLWLKHWNEEIPTPTDYAEVKEVARKYKENYDDLKDILNLKYDANTEDVQGRVKGLLERVDELEKLNTPKVVYKALGKDFEKLLKFGNLLVIIEKEVGING